VNKKTNTSATQVLFESDGTDVMGFIAESDD